MACQQVNLKVHDDEDVCRVHDEHRTQPQEFRARARVELSAYGSISVRPVWATAITTREAASSRSWPTARRFPAARSSSPPGSATSCSISRGWPARSRPGSLLVVPLEGDAADAPEGVQAADPTSSVCATPAHLST